MYAVVKTGGKQYRVSKDDTIMVEFIKAETGSTIYLDNVIMLNNNGDLIYYGMFESNEFLLE